MRPPLLEGGGGADPGQPARALARPRRGPTGPAASACSSDGGASGSFARTRDAAPGTGVWLTWR